MNDVEEPSKPAPTPLDSAMNTGTDDEPTLTVGDKHVGDAPDPNGDGVLTVDEAAALLGDPEAGAGAPDKTAPLMIEGK